MEQVANPSADSPQALLAQARAQRQQHDYLHSIGSAEAGLKALAASSGNSNQSLRAELHFELGSAALSAGHWQQAYDALVQSEKDGHSAAGLYHRLGRAAQELGQLSEAEAHYAKALKLKANAGKTWHQLGRVRELLGAHDGAAEAYQQAIARFEASGDSQALGISAYQLGRIEQSRQAWEPAFDAYSLARRHLASQAQLRAEACYGLSEIALLAQDFGSAEAMLSEAIGIHRHLKNPAGIGICQLKLCQALMLQRRWKDVMRTVAEAIQTLEGTRQSSALKLAYELQGELLQLLNKTEEAASWFAKAQALN